MACLESEDAGEREAAARAVANLAVNEVVKKASLRRDMLSDAVKCSGESTRAVHLSSQLVAACVWFCT